MKKGNLSYANVMATLAFFVAVGGVSYAVNLGKNEVRQKHIAPKAVGSSEIAAEAVGPAEVSGAVGRRISKALGSAFSPPVGSDACAAWGLGASGTAACTDVAGDTKSLGWGRSIFGEKLDCPGGLGPFGGTSALIPSFAVETVSTDFTGTASFAGTTSGLFTVTNWNKSSHDFTIHVPCVSTA